MKTNIDSQGKFQIFTLFSGHHIGVPRRYTNIDGVFILGSANFCEAFRRISEVSRNAQVLNLERCLTYVSSITSQSLSYFHWMVFDLFIFIIYFFYWVTVKTINRPNQKSSLEMEIRAVLLFLRANLKGALSRYFSVNLQCRNMFLHQRKPKNNDAVLLSRSLSLHRNYLLPPSI